MDSDSDKIGALKLLVISYTNMGDTQTVALLLCINKEFPKLHVLSIIQRKLQQGADKALIIDCFEEGIRMTRTILGIKTEAIIMRKENVTLTALLE